MGAQSGPVADYLYAWMAGNTTAPGLDKGLEELHDAVTARLAGDPALHQLTRDATTGTPSARTKRRVNDAVEQAAEDDPAFADRLRNLLGGLHKTATAKQQSRPGFDPFALVPVFPHVVRNRTSAWMQARARRRAELVALGATIKDHDLGRLPMLVAEFTRCRKAHINPMRLSGLPSGAFATVVLLPIVLTALQIFAQVGLGRSGG